MISAGLSLNLAQEFVARSLCAVKDDLRGTEAAKRFDYELHCDFNVFYFYFHVFIRHIREFAFVAYGRRRAYLRLDVDFGLIT